MLLFSDYKLHVTLGSPPDTHQSLHFCGLDRLTLCRLLESSETCDCYTIPLYLSLRGKKRSLHCGHRGPQYPTSKKKKKLAEE